MSQTVQIQIDEKIKEHLKKEAELYAKEDAYKLAKSQERKVFRKLLKEKNMDKEYKNLVEKLRQIKKENNLIENDVARKNYYALLTQKLRITAKIKSEKDFIEANEIAREKAKLFREAYKNLRSDFELNIKPNIPL